MAAADTEAEELAGRALDLLPLRLHGTLQQLVAVLQVPVVAPVLMDAPDGQEVVAGQTLHKRLKLIWRETKAERRLSLQPRLRPLTQKAGLPGTLAAGGPGTGRSPARLPGGVHRPCVHGQALWLCCSRRDLHLADDKLRSSECQLDSNTRISPVSVFTQNPLHPIFVQFYIENHVPPVRWELQK